VRQVLVSSHMQPVIGEAMASSCFRGGLDWILGKISLLKEWSGIGTGCPGKWVESPYLEVFKKRCIYGTSGHGLAGMVVLD